MKFKLIIAILGVVIVILGVAIFKQHKKIVVPQVVPAKVDSKPFEPVVQPVTKQPEPEHFDLEIRYGHIIKR